MNTNLAKKYSFLTLVGLDGFEPSTSRLSGARSNHLSYRPFSWLFSFGSFLFPDSLGVDFVDWWR